MQNKITDEFELTEYLTTEQILNMQSSNKMQIKSATKKLSTSLEKLSNTNTMLKSYPHHIAWLFH